MSLIDRTAADITRGSICEAAPGCSGGAARVLAVSAGYVRFARSEGCIEILHHALFLQRYVPIFEARQVRSQFSMSLANLSNFHVFFSRCQRRIFARSAKVPIESCAGAARGRPALPADAVYVGTYSDPVSPDDFFSDLHDAIADLFSTATAA